MGEAKRRGTFKERQALAVERLKNDELLLSSQKKKKRCVSDLKLFPPFFIYADYLLGKSGYGYSD